MNRVPGGGSVNVLLVRPLALAVGSAPGALETLLSETDLTAERLADDDARISPAQFCVGWAAAVRLSGDPALALRISEAIPQGAFGIVEYVCRTAPTLRDALAQWCRYMRILNDAVDVDLVPTDDGAALRVTKECEAPAPWGHELFFAIVVRQSRLMLKGVLEVPLVAFAHTVDKRVAGQYEAFFKTPVRFGAPYTELLLTHASLDAPLASADPNLFSLLLPAAEESLAKDRGALPLTDQVRRTIRASLQTDDAQLEAVAKRLGMTGRSLQRRLKDEGAVFQTLRDEARRELADRYLEKGMSFAEVSFLLGFSEPSAFFRAFKRWTGVTPLERRAVLGG